MAAGILTKNTSPYQPGLLGAGEAGGHSGSTPLNREAPETAPASSFLRSVGHAGLPGHKSWLAPSLHSESAHLLRAQTVAGRRQGGREGQSLSLTRTATQIHCLLTSTGRVQHEDMVKTLQEPTTPETQGHALSPFLDHPTLVALLQR